MERRLDKILDYIDPKEIIGETNVSFNGVQFDSRLVREGDVFVAVKGVHVDGHDFIENALNRGAVAVVCQYIPKTLNDKTIYALVENTAKALGLLMQALCDFPSKKMTVVGVTGTNGKTTIATLLYHLFEELGYKAGLISTISNKIHKNEMVSSHTTPDQIQIAELMSQMVELGCDYCFMEVSSHASDQDRIEGVDFDGAIFTNLTHDHLDYHKTFKSYLKSKQKFFDGLKADAFALVNCDDKNGEIMFQNSQARRLTYSTRMSANYNCKIIEPHLDGTLLSIDGKDVWTHFVGNYNAYNLLAIYGTALELGMVSDEVLTAISNMKPVDGRFEMFRSADGIYAVVDYAHTPDAVENVIKAINSVRKGVETLITVVGAGGDRDKTKRPEMARIAAELSDKVVLTSDNPRSEDPGQIIKDMEVGVGADKKRNVVSITNRYDAIKTATMLAKPGDIILVAGKGHEDYQEIKGVKHHFDDREVVCEILGIN